MNVCTHVKKIVKITCLFVLCFIQVLHASEPLDLNEDKEYYFALPHCIKEAGEGVRGVA